MVGRYLSVLAATLAFANSVTASEGPRVGTTQPQGFIVNAGQWPASVVACSRADGTDVWITRTGMVVHDHTKPTSGEDAIADFVVSTEWVGALPTATVTFGEAVGDVHFYRGRGDGRHVVAPVVRNLVVDDVLTGVDIVYRIDDRQVRFDLQLEAGIDPQTVTMTWKAPEGTDAVVGGDAVRFTDGERTIRFDGLAVYQGTERRVASFVPAATSTTPALRFSVQGVEHTRPLLIDPLVSGTYLGDADGDVIAGMALQPDGDVVVVGSTQSLDFPVQAGAFQNARLGGQDAYVAVFAPDYRTLRSYAYIGGLADDRARAVAVDEQGNIFLAGDTRSTDFPISTGSAGQIYKAQLDAFVVKLDSTLSNLLVGALIGGNRDDIPTAVAYGSDGTIFIAGSTTSTQQFPTNNGYQKSHGGQLDGFLTKLSANGGAIAYSTYLGKAADDVIRGLYVDATGAPYVTGSTGSSDFPIEPKSGGGWGQPARRPYDASFNGGASDCFITKFGLDGGGLTYSSFWGGTGDDEGRGVVVDELGRAHVVMVTTSTTIETTAGFQPAIAGGKDLAYGVFSDNGRDLVSATYFGGTGDDEALVVRRDRSGNVLVGGSTRSMDFPTIGDGTSSARRGGTDGFFAILTTGANRFCDLVVGQNDDAVVALAADIAGDVVIAATTTSYDSYVSDGVWQPTSGGGASEGWLGKYAFGLLSLATPNGGETVCAGAPVTVTWATTGMLDADRYRVEVSSDDGTTWTELAKGIAGRTYSWDAKGLAEGSGYRVRVMSSRGHIAASASSFFIGVAPAITEQPVAASGCEGASIDLGVKASGTGLKYQWRRNGTVLSGATTSTLSIPSLTTERAGRYDVVISGSCSPAVTSPTVDVVLTPSTAITGQPVSVEPKAGDAAEFRVRASGGGLRYQWKRDGATIADATADVYRIASATVADQGAYTCIVSGDCGEATSEPATLSIVTSVDEEAAPAPLVLAPQPVDAALTVRLPDGPRSGVVRLRDLRGRLVIERPVVEQQAVTLDVLTIDAGTYLVEFQSSSTVHTALVSVVH